MGNLGRNFFTGDRFFNIHLGIVKRVRIRERHNLKYRAEFTSLTNTPRSGFPTTSITGSTFGRIPDNVSSGSRASVNRPSMASIDSFRASDPAARRPG